jgi:hypothetical protein
MKRQFPTAIVLVAWLMFIVSFFLPASNVLAKAGGMPGAPLTGWQTFVASQMMLAYPLTFLLIHDQPRILLFLLFPFINLVMLLAPVVVLAWKDSWLISWIFLLFGLFPWIFPKDMTGDLFIGFYLWDLSFLLMMAGCISVGICRRSRDPATSG